MYVQRGELTRLTLSRPALPCHRPGLCAPRCMPDYLGPGRLSKAPISLHSEAVASMMPGPNLLSL